MSNFISITDQRSDLIILIAQIFVHFIILIKFNFFTIKITKFLKSWDSTDSGPRIYLYAERRKTFEEKFL